MTMISIPYLEIPITHVCNLHCDGCCYYANYNLAAMASAAEIRTSVTAWTQRIKPGMVKILGGEPLINRQLPEIFLAVRQLFPEAHVQVITNGLQLDKCPLLPHLLTMPNTSLSVSIHSNEEIYLGKLQESLNVISGWIGTYGIKVIMSDNRIVWKRHYRGLGPNMQPYNDGDYKASWRACPARECLVLHEARLWKCPQLASLHHVADKFALRDNPAWHPYLAYQGIAADCTDDELRLHLKRGPEAACGMCPVNGETYEKDIHNLEFTAPGPVRVERGGRVVELV